MSSIYNHPTYYYDLNDCFILCSVLSIGYSRKYVGIGQSCVIYAIDILDSERGMTMKADALALLITLQKLQGVLT